MKPSRRAPPRRLALEVAGLGSALALLLACGGDARPAPTPVSRGAAPAPAPLRIVSLAPSVTELLFAVGAGPQVVGVDAYSDYPPEARRLPRVGALLDPDLEAMLRLRPDLAVGLPSQAETVAALRAAGLAVLTVPHETLADVERAAVAIGSRTGHAAAGRALAARLRRASRPRARAAATRPRVLFVVERQPGEMAIVTAVGPGTYLDELIRLAGAANAVAGSPTRYPQISAETALRLRPDLVIEWNALEPGASPAEQAASDSARVREWRVLLESGGHRAALRELHDDLWIRPGPRVVDALAALRGLVDRR